MNIFVLICLLLLSLQNNSIFVLSTIVFEGSINDGNGNGTINANECLILSHADSRKEGKTNKDTKETKTKDSNKETKANTRISIKTPVKSIPASISSNMYAKMVSEMGGVLKLVRLQQHQDHEVYVISLRILETYFKDVVEEDQDGGDGSSGDESKISGQPPRVFRFQVGTRVECLIVESDRGGVWESGTVEELDYHHMCGHCRMLHQSAYLVKLDNGDQCKSSIDDDTMVREAGAVISVVGNVD